MVSRRQTTIAYPFASKMDMIAQVPSLKKDNLKYEQYAGQVYETMFSTSERDGALTYEVVNLATSIAWNEEGAFSLQALPVSGTDKSSVCHCC